MSPGQTYWPRIDWTDNGIAQACPVPSITAPIYCKGISIGLNPSQILARGQIMAESVVAGVYEAYDGHRPARGILKYATWVDATGRITFDGPWGIRWPQGEYSVAPMLICGRYPTQALVGLTAEAVRTLGRILEGTIESGVLDMP